MTQQSKPQGRLSPGAFRMALLGSAMGLATLAAPAVNAQEIRVWSGYPELAPFYEHVAEGMKADYPDLSVKVEAIALREHEKRLALGLTSGEAAEVIELGTSTATRYLENGLFNAAPDDIAAFVQDKTAIERGLFDEELIPEELTVARMGKIIKDKYPELTDEDQEAVRQHAIAALNITQQAKQIAVGGDGGNGSDTEQRANTALIDGVRKFAMDVRELDIDLIDRINPFGEAYAILAKTMSEDSLKQVAAAIAAKRTSLTLEEAKELAVRAVKFKKERGRLPSIDSQDAWERRMAEGAAAFVRFKDEGRYE